MESDSDSMYDGFGMYDYDSLSSSISEDSEDDDYDDDLYSSYQIYGFDSGPATAPKLIDMATFTVAVALCNSNVEELSNYRSRKAIHSEHRLPEEVAELIDKLPVPVSISADIRNQVLRIIKEFSTWLFDHLLKYVFHETDSDDAMCNLFHHVIWYPNGRINYVQTAKKFTNSPTLSDADKYNLMCTYCLKDELESMWTPLVLNSGIHCADESWYPLIHYWNCYFTNNLNQIRRPGNQSLDSLMFQNPEVDNWPAKQYFFDRMTPEEQTQVTISFIDRSKYDVDVDLQKALLRKLNKVQLLHVYTNRAVKIISNYAARPAHYAQEICADIRSTWMEVRDLISREDFFAICKRLLSSRLLSDALLESIWSSASDDFKNHVINHNDHQMVHRALFSLIENRDDFFFKMLSDSSTNVKRAITSKPFFIYRCADLILNDEFSLFDRILNVCFDQTEKLKEFQRNLVKSERFIDYIKRLILEDNLELIDQWLNFHLAEEELVNFKRDLSKKQFFGKHCVKLLTDEKFQKFYRLLNSFVVQTEHLKFRQDLLTNSEILKKYCFDCSIDEKNGVSRLNDLLTSLLPSSPEFIIEYKKNLLMSSHGIERFVDQINPYRCPDLNPIIADCLPTADLATEFKERLVFSPKCIEKFRKWVIFNFLYELDVYIHRYVVSNEDKIALKMRIIGNSVDLICEFLRTNSDKTSWQSLIMWWPRDESSSIDFKSTLSLDEIFNQMLKDCIYSKYDPAHRLSHCKLRTKFLFYSLDRLLNWYFESQIEITEYKSRRIDAYVEIDAITTLLKIRDNRYLEMVLDWIFENNSQGMAEFKVKKKGERIVDVMS